MSDLAERITIFERHYLKRLRHWSAMVAPEELESMNTFLPELQDASEAITNAFTAANSDLYNQRWKSILDQLSTLVPGVIKQLEQVQKHSRDTMSQLGKGARVLRGYRQATPIRPSIFEAES